MEDQPGLFDLQVDPASRAYLTEGSRWARFLSVMGFIFAGLCVLVSLGSFLGNGGTSFAGLVSPVIVAFIYLGIALIYFIVSLSLSRFAIRIKLALDTNDQDKLADGFSQLKNFFRLVGILTIISLAIFALAVILMVIFTER